MDGNVRHFPVLGRTLDALARLEAPKTVDCLPLEAAVAQVLLHDVQHRLPTWGMLDGGQWIQSRKYRRRPAAQTLAFLPQHLFTINWADSGPGFSWPEAYHLVYVPTYERCIVTASQDTNDLWGCTDQAVGFFRAGRNNLEGVGRVIRALWRRLRREYEQPSWCYLFDEGLVPRATAEGWRRRIWREPQ